MNRDEILFDKIEDYLRGKLPPAEAAAFEADIAADPELAELVKLHRLERQGQEWLVERDLLSKMNTWEREVGSSSSVAVSTLRVRRMWWAVGVAASLLVAFFGWQLLRPQEDIGGPSPIVTTPKPKTSPITTPPKTTPKPSQKTPTSKPAEEAAQDDRVAEKPKSSPTVPTPKPQAKPPAPAAPTVDYAALAAAYYLEGDFIQNNNGNTGKNKNTPNDYGQALDNYKSGKYSDVEKLLKPALKSKPDALKEKELLAHSLYKSGQYDAAITYLKELSNSKDVVVAQRSEWGLALALLHKMPAKKAQLHQLLDKIGDDPQHGFIWKARNLKTELGF